MAELCKASRYAVPWKDTLVIINQGHQQWSDKDSTSLSSLACLLQTKAVHRRGSPKAVFINSFKHGGLWKINAHVTSRSHYISYQGGRVAKRVACLTERSEMIKSLGQNRMAAPNRCWIYTQASMKRRPREVASKLQCLRHFPDRNGF